MNHKDETQGIALIKRIAAKDRKAFEEFYYLYAEGFGKFLMKMLKQKDWVDEAVNDVMLTVWQQALCSSLNSNHRNYALRKSVGTRKSCNG